MDYVVATKDGERPDDTNKGPLTSAGRGSIVWFNQCTMFQSSETGFPTKKEAEANGHSGKRDWAEDIADAYPIVRTPAEAEEEVSKI